MFNHRGSTFNMKLVRFCWLHSKEYFPGHMHMFFIHRQIDIKYWKYLSARAVFSAIMCSTASNLIPYISYYKSKSCVRKCLLLNSGIICFCFCILFKYRLLEEIDAVVGDKESIDYEDIVKLEYMSLVSINNIITCDHYPDRSNIFWVCFTGSERTCTKRNTTCRRINWQSKHLCGPYSHLLGILQTQQNITCNHMNLWTQQMQH